MDKWEGIQNGAVQGAWPAIPIPTPLPSLPIHSTR